MKLYVAASWKNGHRPEAIRVLQAAGHDVYDSCHPSRVNNGFHWSEIDPNYKDWSVSEYVDALEHPIAEAGFDNDYHAMTWAEGYVLGLPCNPSAHLKAGWFAGKDLPLFILLEKEEFTPELMYKLGGRITDDLAELLEMIDQFPRDEPSP